MALKIRVDTSGFTELKRELAERCTKTEHDVAIRAEKDTQPFVPALTRTLAKRTRVIGNSIVYPGPYARYLYYGKVMVDEHGNGPKHFVDSKGNEVIKFPEGSKLHATDRNLVFNKSVHPQAQAHWFEASKAQNLDKWVRVAAKGVTKHGTN